MPVGSEIEAANCTGAMLAYSVLGLLITASTNDVASSAGTVLLVSFFIGWKQYCDTCSEEFKTGCVYLSFRQSDFFSHAVSNYAVTLEKKINVQVAFACMIVWVPLVLWWGLLPNTKCILVTVLSLITSSRTLLKYTQEILPPTLGSKKVEERIVSLAQVVNDVTKRDT